MPMIDGLLEIEPTQVKVTRIHIYIVRQIPLIVKILFYNHFKDFKEKISKWAIFFFVSSINLNGPSFI